MSKSGYNELYIQIYPPRISLTLCVASVLKVDNKDGGDVAAAASRRTAIRCSPLKWFVKQINEYTRQKQQQQLRKKRKQIHTIYDVNKATAEHLAHANTDAAMMYFGGSPFDAKSQKKLKWLQAINIRLFAGIKDSQFMTWKIRNRPNLSTSVDTMSTIVHYAQC